MTRMNADYYGFCRAPDGRSVPCNQFPGDGLAQLALMLRGSGMLDQRHAGDISGSAINNLPVAANNQRPAYENSWATIAQNAGPPAPGSHLPITKAQEIFIAPSQPYIDTIPWRPEYFPFPPGPMPLPPEPMPFPPGVFPLPPRVRPFPVPQDIPVPSFERPSYLGPHANPDEDWPFPDTEECQEEIDKAHKTCRQHVRQLKSGRQVGNFGYSVIQCMRGLLSEECGGNPVDWGKGGPPLRA